MRRLASAVGITCLAAAMVVVPAAPAAAATTNGPILVESGIWGSLRALDGTKVTDLRFALSRSDFNASGDKLAFSRTQCVDDACTDDVTMVVVRDNTGEETEYGPINGTVWDVTWSPDGTQVAFVTTNDDNGATAISRFPLSATEPVLVAGETSDRQIALGSTIDWGPQGIVFVGSELPGGSGPAVDGSQLYTVPGTGGSWSRYNVHYAQECDLGSTCYYDFENPSWSPDGNRVLTETVRNDIDGNGDSVDNRFLATIGNGGKVPTMVTELRDGDYGYYGEPQYSPDGAEILFTDDDGTDYYAATVGSDGSGRTRLPAAVRTYGDWQPCPDGVCASWGVQDKLPSRITLNLTTTQTRIKASGKVTPDKSGQVVSLTLRKLVNGSWRKVATATPTLVAGSAYTASWRRPTVQMCSLTGRYPGDATHLPATTKMQFYC